MTVPSTHFETTAGLSHVFLDEPLLTKCDMQGWPIAAAVLALVAFVLLSLRPSRWHFVAGVLASLTAPLAVLAAQILVPRARSDDGGVFDVFRIELPYEQIFLTVAFATLAIAIGITALVAKKDLRLRIAASVIATLAVGPIVRSFICARAFRTAITDLADVHAVPQIEVKEWPKGVHAGQPFNVHVELLPAAGGRSVDAREWRTLGSYTATAPGAQSVTLFAERGPMRVERKIDLQVFRDEGPSWLPLALGNSWTLTKFVGKPWKIGAVDRAFEKDAPDPKGAHKVLRVVRETFGGGLHEWVLQLEDADGTKRETTVYRRDGELVRADTNASVAVGDFPLLGTCRYAIKPIDDARMLAGPTVCGFTTYQQPYGDRGFVGSVIGVLTLGFVDTRATRPIEEGFVLAHSGRE
jgi:hypothetical protein